MKKWMLIVIIAILFVTTILLAIFFNAPKVVATDTVDMEYFNKIVEELNTKINTTQEQVVVLENENNDLKDKITALNTKISSLEIEVDKNYSILNKNIIKVQNWQTTYIEATIKGFTNYGTYRYMTNYMKTQ